MGITSFNPDKMYTYLWGFASGAGMKETLKALLPTDAVPPGQVFGSFFPADCKTERWCFF